MNYCDGESYVVQVFRLDYWRSTGRVVPSAIVIETETEPERRVCSATPAGGVDSDATYLVWNHLRSWRSSHSVLKCSAYVPLLIPVCTPRGDYLDAAWSTE